VFENITPESIKANILAAIDTNLDTREGSFLNEMITPVAMELWKCYQSLKALIPIAFVDETSGPYIDKRCEEYGIKRKAGTKATAEINFTGSSGAVIPAGTAFLTAGGLEFRLKEQVTLVDGAGTGLLEAVNVGEAYNVDAGEITSIVRAIPGLTSFTNAAASGGTDPETDEALLARLNARRQTPAISGNAYHYRQWALEVNGVGDAKVLPLWEGPGTVKVLLVGPEKQPVDESVVSACALHIAEESPIGAIVTVESAEGLTINVEAAVTIDSTTTKAKVQEQLVSKLDTYLKSLAFKGYTLLYNRVAFFLLDIDGVVDFTSLKINGGTGNITIAESQVPVLGTVTVT